MGALWAVDLGSVEYGRALALQEAAHAARVEGRIADTLLLLEHPPTITLGRAADERHLLAPPERLAELGIAVHETARGGDVTFHGPGQLVGYPILDASRYRGRLPDYLRDIEEALIRTLDRWGIEGQRIEGLTGVFVGGAKVAAIGVQVRRWVTLHGFALNVTTDLSQFAHIVPCGIVDHPVTSMARLLDEAPSREEVVRRAAEGLAEVLGAEAEWGREAEVVALREVESDGKGCGVLPSP